MSTDSRCSLAAVLAAVLAACLDAACGPAHRAAPDADTCEDLSPERGAGLPHHFRADRPLMGTSFQIRVVASDAPTACAAIDAAFAEVAREEDLFSEYRATSEISAINRAAGDAPVVVDPEVFSLLQRSAWASRATDGAFDITFAGCGRLWSIRERRVPSEEAMAACLPRVGFENLRLDAGQSSVFLPEAGMAIGVGGIAKGYGVDRAASVLQAHGIDRFVVDGGGDLRVEGTDIDGPWTVHIAHPRRTDRPYATIRLDHGAIVTSGDYLRYFEKDGERIHHIMDPTTGRPARRTVAVTVIAPNATDADALATGLFVLGPERGLAIAATLPGVEALYFDPDLEVHSSRGFPRISPVGRADPSEHGETQRSVVPTPASRNNGGQRSVVAAAATSAAQR